MSGAGIVVKGLRSGYEIENLVRMFYPFSTPCGGKDARKQDVLVYARATGSRLAAGYRDKNGCRVKTEKRPEDPKKSDLLLARCVYDLLREVTGVCLPWGMLTGVRPVRLLRKRTQQMGAEDARRLLTEDYDVGLPRIQLLEKIAKRQEPVLQSCAPADFSLYISIPFCPSRCSYCSFVSQSIEREAALIDPYLDHLDRELALTAEMVKKRGLRLRTVYMGGGTPTVLTTKQLHRVLGSVRQHFEGPADEYTVEAGRPDCTSYEKLKILKEYGVGRISINPQSMSDDTLAAIGRRHSAADVLRCYEDACKAGHERINMDLIAGLPGDSAQSFCHSLELLGTLAPANLTVHTLTLKRGSQLLKKGEWPASEAREMLEKAYPFLEELGYQPYYLYRQKGTPGNLENTGWTKPGAEGLYNIFIMEEVQSILSVGAGGVTKLVADGGALIKRYYNDKYPLEYLRQFEKVFRQKKEVEDMYASILDPQKTR